MGGSCRHGGTLCRYDSTSLKAMPAAHFHILISAPTRKSGFGGVELLSQLRAKTEDLAAGHCLP